MSKPSFRLVVVGSWFLWGTGAVAAQDVECRVVVEMHDPDYLSLREVRERAIDDEGRIAYRGRGEDGAYRLYLYDIDDGLRPIEREGFTVNGAEGGSMRVDPGAEIIGFRAGRIAARARVTVPGRTAATGLLVYDVTTDTARFLEVDVIVPWEIIGDGTVRAFDRAADTHFWYRPDGARQDFDVVGEPVPGTDGETFGSAAYPAGLLEDGRIVFGERDIPGLYATDGTSIEAFLVPGETPVGMAGMPLGAPAMWALGPGGTVVFSAERADDESADRWRGLFVRHGTESPVLLHVLNVPGEGADYAPGSSTLRARMERAAVGPLGDVAVWGALRAGEEDVGSGVWHVDGRDELTLVVQALHSSHGPTVPSPSIPDAYLSHFAVVPAGLRLYVWAEYTDEGGSPVNGALYGFEEGAPYLVHDFAEPVNGIPVATAFDSAGGGWPDRNSPTNGLGHLLGWGFNEVGESVHFVCGQEAHVSTDPAIEAGLTLTDVDGYVELRLTVTNTGTAALDQWRSTVGISPPVALSADHEEELLPELCSLTRNGDDLITEITCNERSALPELSLEPGGALDTVRVAVFPVEGADVLAVEAQVTASADDDREAHATAEETIPLVGPHGADLVALTDTRELPGGSREGVGVLNEGPATAEGAVLTITVLPRYALEPDNLTGCTVDDPGDASPIVVTCPLGDLSPGDVRILDLRRNEHLTEGGAVDIAVRSSTPDHDLTNNTDMRFDSARRSGGGGCSVLRTSGSRPSWLVLTVLGTLALRRRRDGA